MECCLKKTTDDKTLIGEKKYCHHQKTCCDKCRYKTCREKCSLFREAKSCADCKFAVKSKIKVTKDYPFNLAEQIFENDTDALTIDIQNILILLDNLTKREQTIIKLRYIEKKTYREIGNMLDLSITCVQYNHTKALRKLKNPARAKSISNYLGEYTIK